MKILSQQTSFKERQNFWDRVALSFKSVRNAYSTKIYGDGEWRLIKKFFGNIAGKNFLKLDLWNEVNNTTILDIVISNGANVSAVDVSPVLVERAKKNFARFENFSFVVGDIRSIPFETNCFDFVYTMGTIEHIPDPENAIKEIHRVLKKNGLAIIGVPYKYDPFGRAAFLWLGNKFDFLPYGEELCFSWGQFKKMILVADFDIIAKSGAYFIPWPFRFADIWINQHMPVFSYILYPFLFVCKVLSRFDFLCAHNSLIAYVVRKK